MAKLSPSVLDNHSVRRVDAGLLREDLSLESTAPIVPIPAVAVLTDLAIALDLFVVGKKFLDASEADGPLR